MSTIRVTVEVPELSDVELAVLREYARSPHERLPVCGPSAAQAGGLLHGKGLLGWTEPTPLGRAVLEHYEGGR